MASPLLQDPSNYANHRIAKACKKAKGTHIIPLQNMYGVIQKKKKKAELSLIGLARPLTLQ